MSSWIVNAWYVAAWDAEVERTPLARWGMARSFEVGDAGFTARFKKQQGAIFAEDLEILEAQQRSLELNPDLKLQGYTIDEGCVRARQLISRTIRQPAEAGATP